MSLVVYEHPFALYCWKALIALYERDVPFTAELVELEDCYTLIPIDQPRELAREIREFAR